MGPNNEPTQERPFVGSMILDEETLIVDERERLRPAQLVDRKLRSMLHGAPVSVSHLQEFVRRRPG